MTILVAILEIAAIAAATEVAISTIDRSQQTRIFEILHQVKTTFRAWLIFSMISKSISPLIDISRF